MRTMSMTKGWLVMVALGAVLLAGCSKSSGGDPDGGDTDSDTNVECAWEVMVPPGEDNPFGGEGIEFLKGCSKEQVYLKAADQGPVFELDGGEWVETAVQPPSEDLWLVDLACLSDGSTLWVGAIQGPIGVIYRYDGEEWALQDIPVDRGLYRIWAVSDDDIYVTPEEAFDVGGIPLHFDGEEWALVDLPEVDFNFTIDDLWASGPADVYFVGHKAADGTAVVFHFDGSDWEVTDFTDRGWIFPSSIWGSGPGDVYMAIEPYHPEPPFESIVRWDGTSWDTFQEWGPVEGEEKEFENVMDIWGTGPDNIYFIGQGVGLWHWSEGAMTLELDSEVEIEPGITPGFRMIWGSGQTDIYGASDRVMHYTCH